MRTLWHGVEFESFRQVAELLGWRREAPVTLGKVQKAAQGPHDGETKQKTPL